MADEILSLVSPAGNAAAEGAAVANNASAPVVPLLPGAPPPAASGTDVEAQTSQRKLKRTTSIVGLVAADEHTQKTKKGCVGCCMEFMRKELCGFELPQLAMLLASVAMPTLDAASDWAVTISFYFSGDMGWFTIGLIIQLVGGTLCGLTFAAFIFDGDEGRFFQRHTCFAMVVGVLVGLPGLAGVAFAARTLQAGANGDVQGSKSQTKLLKIFKGMELLFEGLPQSLLQMYVGVAYGQLNPSGNEFNPLLVGSVAVSLLSGGATVFGLEVEGRSANENIDVVPRLASRYGFVTVMQR